MSFLSHLNAACLCAFMHTCVCGVVHSLEPMLCHTFTASGRQTICAEGKLILS